ncbi:sensor domain-containing diguanylate cyclase [Rheinheimera sp. KL1]|uniref:sensor domain-containing diguanylate cyclase n=1 Tax=Rheinheimera sp. KL1 TaxID=1635005 RepID=UPI0009E6BCFA|nr:sensor domain-containing diguanylate cyclase [Rheinheimera sp. KL1]
MSKQNKCQVSDNQQTAAAFEATQQTQVGPDQHLHPKHLQDPNLQDPNLKDIVQLARYICDAPIALVTRADEKELSFIANIGFSGSSVAVKESFCVHAMDAPDTVMVVPDARLDSRFKENPMVLGEQGYRFYAGSPLVSPQGKVIGTICVFDYIAKQLNQKQIESLQALSRQVIAMLELKKLSEQLHQTSMTDALTGVHNRRAFDQRLDYEFSRWLRTGQSFVLALIDVDHFKSFNDSFGHAAGDQALHQVAAVLQQHSRNYDFFARYGGEEFALILPGTDLVSAYKKLEQLRQLVANHPWPLRPLTISIGLAAAENMAQQKQLLEAADQALYKAKHLGRNQSSIFSKH